MYKILLDNRIIQARLPDPSVSVITIQYHAKSISTILSVVYWGKSSLNHVFPSY